MDDIAETITGRVVREETPALQGLPRTNDGRPIFPKGHPLRWVVLYSVGTERLGQILSGQEKL